MKASVLSPVWALVGLAAAQFVQEVDEHPVDEQLGPQTTEYIVEFAQDAPAHVKRQLFIRDEITVLKTFDSDVFRGATINTTAASSVDTVAALRALPNVVAVWPNSPLTLLAPVKRETIVPESAADDYAVHWATHVDELHAQGVYGKGVKVGVVDTGIWYSHPALGGGFGPGFKVRGGWDFVGDGPWTPGITAKRPDADPVDEQSHGTHVAGIVAGNSTTSGWRGVAPDASLYAYKVFGSADGTDTSTLMEAFLRAYEDGMDVITASVGSRGGFASNPWALLASRLVERGVVVSIAAGNSGTGGPFYASTGSAGEGVLCVASAHVRSATKDVVPSYFTSWGGLYDLAVKPDVAGPGTDIFSTWPRGSGNDFSLLSGTSMATPYLAGVAALWISRHGGRAVHGPAFAKTLAMRIVASGNPMPWLNYDQSPNEAFLAPSQQVGTGLVDARKVLRSTSTLPFQMLALNDTRHFQAEHDVVLRNARNESVAYEFSAESWAGFDMLADYDAAQADETPRLRYRPEMLPAKVDARVQVPNAVTLGPGETKTLKFTFALPNGLNETKLPAYSGRVLVSSTLGEELSIPYQGVAFDMREQFAEHMFAGTYPYMRSTPAYSNKTTFTFDLSTKAQDFPRIYWKLNWGTKELRLDIYEPGFDASRDWEYPPVPNRNNHIASAAPWVQASSLTFNPAVHNRDNTYDMPQRDVTRNALVTGGFTGSLFWLGRFTNGSYIQPGDYVLRFAALIPFADPREAKSWSTFTSEFKVLSNRTRQATALST